MKQKENMLAAKMLDLASSVMANNTCNDFDFPQDWTEEERKVFVKEFYEFNGDPEEYDENHLSLPDFCVADLLAYKLENNK